MKNGMVFILSVAMTLELSGCASLGKKWKSLVSGDSSNSDSADGRKSMKAAPSFNTEPNYGTPKERQYKRVTKENFTDEQMVDENAGSLWKKEGQGSFLFTQNNLRVIGDIINVDVEGKAAENLAIKAKLLVKAQMKTEVPRPQSVAKNVAKVPRPEGTANENRAPAAAATPAPGNTEENGQAAANPAAKKEEGPRFDSVPCRIVEKNPDGSYRVKGFQIVFVGKKEYKLIVTGNIRADEISMDSISSSKVLDSKFDLVATNKDFFK